MTQLRAKINARQRSPTFFLYVTRNELAQLLPDKLEEYLWKGSIAVKKYVAKN